VERRLAAILAADVEGSEKRLRFMLWSSSWARTELQPGLSPRANVTEQAASAIDDNRKMRLRPSGFDTVRATL
jgi:hypothetical protein